MVHLHSDNSSISALALESMPVTGQALPVLRLESVRGGSVDHVLMVGTNTVGRDPDNDVVLRGTFVSRRHCLILVYPSGHCAVRDLDSLHGVYVNGQPITRM